MKILFIFFLSTISIFAADTYVFYVNSEAMVDQYFLIFNAMKNIFSSDSYIELLRFVFLLGGFFALASGVLSGFGKKMNGAVSGYFKYIVIGTSLLVLLFAGKSDLLIKYNSTGKYCSDDSKAVAVSEFPTLLGFSFNFINKVGNNLIALSEEQYSTILPESSSIKNGGYGHSIKDSIKFLSVNLSDDYNLSTKDDLSFQMKSFFTQCIIIPFSNKGVEGDTELNKLKASSDIYTYLADLYVNSPHTIGGINSRDYEVNVNGEVYTCGAYYDKIKPNLDEFKDDSVCMIDADSSALSLMVGGTTPPVSKYQDVAIQAGLIATLNESYENVSSSTTSINYASGKSKAEMVQENIASGSYMAEMLPLIQSTLRIVLYAFFPFVFVIILLPGGLRVLKDYMKTLIWIEMWTPAAAVLNLFLNFRSQSELTGIMSSQGLTSMSAIDLTSSIGVIAGLAGYLYTMIPGLTWAFISGSAMMIENLGMALGKNIMKNIRTESMNIDIQQTVATQEANRQLSGSVNHSGSDLSMAEMQHFDAVSAGRSKGAMLATQNKMGLTDSIDMMISKKAEEVEVANQINEITGTSGEEQGKIIAQSKLVDNVITVNTVKETISSNESKTFKNFALNSIKSDTNKELGTMDGKSDIINEGGHTQEQFSDTVKTQNAKQLGSNKALKAYAGGNSLSDQNKKADSDARAEVRQNVNSDTVTKNSMKGANYIAKEQGKQELRKTEVTKSKNKHLESTGMNAKRQGISEGKSVHSTANKQKAEERLGRDAGIMKNASQSERNRFEQGQAYLNESVKTVDKDGNVVTTNFTGNYDTNGKAIINTEETQIARTYSEKDRVRFEISEKQANGLNKNDKTTERLLEVMAHGGVTDSQTLAEVHGKSGTGSVNGKKLLNVIAHGEGTSDRIAQHHGFKDGYHVTYAFGKYVPKGTDITKMTFAEIKQLRKVMLKKQADEIKKRHLSPAEEKKAMNARSTAMGKYQFTGVTLKEYQKAAGLKDSDLFNKTNQDKMGLKLLENSGLRSYRKGLITKEQFQDRLAARWASVAESGTGKSKYGQHTGTSTKTIQSAIAGKDVKLSDNFKTKRTPEQEILDKAFIDVQKSGVSFDKVYTIKEIQHIYSNLEEASRISHSFGELMKLKKSGVGILRHMYHYIRDKQKRKKKFYQAVAKRKQINYLRAERKALQKAEKVIDKTLKALDLSNSSYSTLYKLKNEEHFKKVEQELSNKYDKEFRKADIEREKSLSALNQKKTNDVQKIIQDEVKRKEWEARQDKKALNRWNKSINQRKKILYNINKNFNKRVFNLSNQIKYEKDGKKQFELIEKLNKIADQHNKITLKINNDILGFKSKIENMEKGKPLSILEKKAKIIESKKEIKDELLKKKKIDKELYAKVSPLKSKLDNVENKLKANKTSMDKIKLMEDYLNSKKLDQKNPTTEAEKYEQEKFKEKFKILSKSEMDKLHRITKDDSKMTLEEKKKQKAEFREFKEKMQKLSIVSKIKSKDLMKKKKRLTKDFNSLRYTINKNRRAIYNLKIKESYNLSMNEKIKRIQDKYLFEKNIIEKRFEKKTALPNDLKAVRNIIKDIKLIKDNNGVDKVSLSEKIKNFDSDKNSLKALENVRRGTVGKQTPMVQLKLGKMQREMLELRKLKESENRRTSLSKAIDEKKKELLKPVQKFHPKKIISGLSFGVIDGPMTTDEKIKALNKKMMKLKDSLDAGYDARDKFLRSVGTLEKESILKLNNSEEMKKINEELKISDDLKKEKILIEKNISKSTDKIKRLTELLEKNKDKNVRKNLRKSIRLEKLEIARNKNKILSKDEYAKKGMLSEAEYKKKLREFKSFERNARMQVKALDKRMVKNLKLSNEKADNKAHKKHSRSIQKAKDGAKKLVLKSKEVKNLSKENKTLKKDLDKLNKALDNINQENNKKNKKIQRDISNLEKELETMNKDSVEYSSKLKDLDKLKEENKKEMKIQEKITSTIQDRISDLSKLEKNNTKKIEKEIKIAQKRAEKIAKERAEIKESSKLHKTRDLMFKVVGIDYHQAKKKLPIGTTSRSWQKNFAVANKAVDKDLYRTQYTDGQGKLLDVADSAFDRNEKMMKALTAKDVRDVEKKLSAIGKMTKGLGVTYLLAEAENQLKGIKDNKAATIVEHTVGMGGQVIGLAAKGYYNTYKNISDSNYLSNSIEAMNKRNDLIKNIQEDVFKNKEIMDNTSLDKLSDEELAKAMFAYEDGMKKISELRELQDSDMRSAIYVANAQSKYNSSKELLKGVNKEWDDGVKEFNKGTWTGGTYEEQDMLLTKAVDAINYLSENVTKERMNQFYESVRRIGAATAGKSASLIEAEIQAEVKSLLIEIQLNNHGANKIHKVDSAAIPLTDTVINIGEEVIK